MDSVAHHDAPDDRDVHDARDVDDVNDARDDRDDRDASAHINTTAALRMITRAVAFSTEGPERYSVILELSLPVPTQRLWSTLTDPTALSRWFNPVEGELRAGGAYSIPHHATGIIERCQVGTGFSLTWEYEGEVSRVGVRLTPAPGVTALRLEHVCDIDTEVYPEYGPGAVGIGWDLALLGLIQHLLHDAVVPPESTDWMRGPEALSFMEESSRAWADAAIAAGTETHHARMAQERCTTAYVGIG